MTVDPPRWHTDPTGRHELRYWSGEAWTEHVSDRGVTTTDRLEVAATDEAHLMPTSEGRSIPAAHEPVPVELPTPPRRTQAIRPQVTDSGRPPRPIITGSGSSGRAKLLVAFVVLDLAVAAGVIWLVTR